MKPVTLLVPAAGLGTRLRPATYVTPKELLRLVDKPILYYLLAEAHLAGITQVVLITHQDNRKTREFFESAGAASLLADFPGLKVECVETNARGGDGQALLVAEGSVDGPFAVAMGDIVTLPGTSLLAELAERLSETGEAIISVEDVPREKTLQYGIIDPVSDDGPLYRVRGIVEKPAPASAPSTLAMTGRYILPPKIFDYLHQLEDGGGELKLAHALDLYAKDRPLNALTSHTRHYDTGTKIDLLKAEIAFSLVHPDLKDRAREALKQALPQ